MRTGSGADDCASRAMTIATASMTPSERRSAGSRAAGWGRAANSRRSPDSSFMRARGIR